MKLCTPQIDLCRESVNSPVAVRLIRDLNDELTKRYPEEGTQDHYWVTAEEVSNGRGGFFVAYLDGRPVGCGAVRRIAPDVAEIKRMYVAPSVRGQRVGRAILNVLENEAHKLDVHRLVLETGPRQPEAIAMYQHAGFVEIPLFGEYIGSKFSVCMAKDL